MKPMPALPQLDGVDFRPFRDDSDYPEFARIITAVSRGEGNDRVETGESVAAGYEHLERCDPKSDLLVAEVESRPIGYGRSWWDQEAGGPCLYKQVCFVEPASGGRGIGSALFAWNEERLREIAAGHGAPNKMFEAWVNDRNEAATTLIRGGGFEPVTYAAEMVRPSVENLPDHPLPEGVEIRPVSEDQLRAIWDADTEAFRDHWGFVEPTRPPTPSSSRSRTTTRRCGRSPGTTKASQARFGRSSTPRRTPSAVSGAVGPSSSRPRVAGGVAASRRRSS
jgi:mycothiol synthase